MSHRSIVLTAVCIILCATLVLAQDVSPQLQRFLDHVWAAYFGKMPRQQYDSLDLNQWAGVLGAAYRLQWEKVLDAPESAQKHERKAHLETLWRDLQNHVGNHANKFTNIGYSAQQVQSSLSDGFWYRGYDEPEYEIAKLFGVDDPQQVPSIFDTPLPVAQPDATSGVDSSNPVDQSNPGSQPAIDGHWEMLSGYCSYSIRGQDPQKLYRYYRYRKQGHDGIVRTTFYLYPANGQAREEPHPDLEMIGYDYLDKILADIREWCRVAR